MISERDRPIYRGDGSITVPEIPLEFMDIVDAFSPASRVLTKDRPHAQSPWPYTQDKGVLSNQSHEPLRTTDGRPTTPLIGSILGIRYFFGLRNAGQSFCARAAIPGIEKWVIPLQPLGARFVTGR